MRLDEPAKLPLVLPPQRRDIQAFIRRWGQCARTLHLLGTRPTPAGFKIPPAILTFRSPTAV